MKDELGEKVMTKVSQSISKSILKTQQRFKSERHNVFTEEINKIALIIKECNQWNEQRSSK